MNIIKDYDVKDDKNEDKECVIILEGMDDIYFIKKLLSNLSADHQKIGLVQVGGTPRFEKQLNFFFKSANYTQGKIKSIAIICDSDDSPQKITKSIHCALKAANEPTPHSGSHITNTKGIKIGFFTLPQPEVRGDLEKLCLESVKDNELAIAAKKYIAEAKGIAQKNATTMAGSIYKREAQVYLGGVPNAQSRGAGKGFYDGHFDVNHPNLNPLKRFLLETIKIDE